MELLMPFLIEILTLVREMLIPHHFKTRSSHNRQNFIPNSLAVTCSFSNHGEHLLIKIFRRQEFLRVPSSHIGNGKDQLVTNLVRQPKLSSRKLFRLCILSFLPS